MPNVIVDCTATGNASAKPKRLMRLLLLAHEHVDATISGSLERRLEGKNEIETLSPLSIRVTELPFHVPSSPKQDFYRYDFEATLFSASIWTGTMQPGQASLKTAEGGPLLSMTCSRRELP